MKLRRISIIILSLAFTISGCVTQVESCQCEMPELGAGGLIDSVEPESNALSEQPAKAKPRSTEELEVQTHQNHQAPDLSPTAVVNDETEDLATLADLDGSSTIETNQTPEKPVSEQLLVKSESAVSPSDAENRQENRYIVTVSHLNVRNGPAMSNPVVGVLAKDHIVTALGREGIWVMISEGEYVSINFLREVSAEVQANL